MTWNSIIQGAILKGWYQRDARHHHISTDYVRRLENDNQYLSQEAGLRDSQEFLEAQRSACIAANARHEFEAFVYHTGPSGIFVAGCKDSLGDSGLVGTIEEETHDGQLRFITFDKIYAGCVPIDMSPNAQRPTSIRFTGNYDIRNDRFSARGTYVPELTPTDGRIYAGTWELSLYKSKLEQEAELGDSLSDIGMM